MKSFVVGLYASVKVGVYSYLAKADVCNGAVSLCGSGSVVDPASSFSTLPLYVLMPSSVQQTAASSCTSTECPRQSASILVLHVHGGWAGGGGVQLLPSGPGMLRRREPLEVRAGAGVDRWRAPAATDWLRRRVRC